MKLALMMLLCIVQLSHAITLCGITNNTSRAILFYSDNGRIVRHENLLFGDAMPLVGWTNCTEPQVCSNIWLDYPSRPYTDSEGLYPIEGFHDQCNCPCYSHSIEGTWGKIEDNITVTYTVADGVETMSLTGVGDVVVYPLRSDMALSLFFEAWLSDDEMFDLNTDGIVNWIDFALWVNILE